ncbi:DinB family protein [Psychrobacillus sp. NPDC096426]|uniref:DinB family protein n=1 Tax=Psychrobacillus sp. NPDC096426 TaxID=3364491 RepID=UPI0038204C56
MTIENLKESSTIIKSIIDQMVHIIEATETSFLYKKPSDEEWSVMQIACHVIEAVEFWVADLEALLIVPGAKWGRNHEHVRRLAAVEENYVASVSTEQVITRLQSLISLTKRALSKVQAEDLSKTAPSYNANFDGKPLSFLIDHLIVKHIESHLGQMVRHLEKVQYQKS